ncbi:hypothetical protein HHI36_013034 [Cryptolaemus montrouzieri]|uniref:Uncharacterized protein n=1 Tax=Cryptolaemus montrouzieri TaxID=559131 RepID=A0ABD2NGI2_9CUCU
MTLFSEVIITTCQAGFGRNKIIALALLCGSDYWEGVQGVGKDCSLKLFEKYSDEEILDRMRQWRNQPSIFEELERKLGDKNICTSCGHSGRVQSHNQTVCFYRLQDLWNFLWMRFLKI